MVGFGDWLVHTPDDAPRSETMARLFHHSLAQLRDAEAALEAIYEHTLVDTGESIFPDIEPPGA